MAHTVVHPPKFTCRIEESRKTRSLASAEDPLQPVVGGQAALSSPSSEIPAQQLVERPFEQPVDRLNNCWSYILFDRMDHWACFFFNSVTSALRRPASSRCDRSPPSESYTYFVFLKPRARSARACPVLTRSAPPPSAPLSHVPSRPTLPPHTPPPLP